MDRFLVDRVRRRMARTLGFVAGALLFGSLALSGPVAAAPRGGFHGGGMHGGFAGDAFHGGIAAGMHGGFGGRGGVAGGGHWMHGWHGGRYGWWWGDGLGWTYYPYPAFGYDGYPEAVASQYWYCTDPPGYYPYVTQCNMAWQTAPGS